MILPAIQPPNASYLSRKTIFSRVVSPNNSEDYRIGILEAHWRGSAKQSHVTHQVLSARIKSLQHFHGENLIEFLIYRETCEGSRHGTQQNCSVSIARLQNEGG